MGTTQLTQLTSQLQFATGVTLEQYKMQSISLHNAQHLQLLDVRSSRIMNQRIFQGSQITNWADLYLNPTIAGSNKMRNKKTQDRLATYSWIDLTDNDLSLPLWTLLIPLTP